MRQQIPLGITAYLSPYRAFTDTQCNYPRMDGQVELT